MGKDAKLTPNTHLGEVVWWRDMHFGKLLYVCQSLLGLDPEDTYDYNFIHSKKHGVDDLWEFFEEIKLENGKLGLELYTDKNWHTVVLATIETTLPYGEAVEDQVFLNLIADFIEYVRGLPLGEAGEDSYTEEEMVRAQQCVEEFLGPIFKILAETDKTAEPTTKKNEDDIPF